MSGVRDSVVSAKVRIPKQPIRDKLKSRALKDFSTPDLAEPRLSDALSGLQ
jgi:hypothetical protein